MPLPLSIVKSKSQINLKYSVLAVNLSTKIDKKQLGFRFINVFNRRVTGFHRLAKLFELNF